MDDSVFSLGEESDGYVPEKVSDYPIAPRPGDDHPKRCLSSRKPGVSGGLYM